jgi:hypothetical protein
MHADVWRQHHDELAGFMAAMAPDGAAQAVNLTGLTLKGEMDMALRIGQYRRVPLHTLHPITWLNTSVKCVHLLTLCVPHDGWLLSKNVAATSLPMPCTALEC